jgi:3-hydroxyacyl-CoA dehydrogenase/enoyl-CoA hydratase/3-hydroxybutyryl-CoA epimerase
LRLEALSAHATTVAVIGGACLGGGLELALACEFRVALPSARLGLPECRLGLVPGAGGTARLPAVCGSAAAAVEMIVSGSSVDAQRALGLGIVDAVLPAAAAPGGTNGGAADGEAPADADLVAAAASAAAAIDRLPARPISAKYGRTHGVVDWLVRRTWAGRQLMYTAMQRGASAKTKGRFPAIGEALAAAVRGTAVRNDDDLRAALEAEADAFGRVAVTPEALSLINLFLASRQAKRTVSKFAKGGDGGQV